ncbi:MAG: choice-of-anchor D domain-containing protein [Myxococcales bacterium]|nr:choice-of-anchor D domain-containing protein [Myxococcales bacterium]
MNRVAVLGLLVASACNGEGPGIRTLVPGFAVAPESLDFGDVGVPLAASQELYITNTGAADLEVSLGFGDALGVFSMDSESDLVLSPSEEHTVTVTFAPDTFRDYDTALRFDTNDEDHPVETVRVQGTGADLPLPDITILPAPTVELVDVPLDQEELLYFEVANDGGLPLVISDVRLEGDPTFALVTDLTDAVVAPGDRTALIATYTPTHEKGDLADVFLTSNDPDEPETQVRLVGNGGGDLFERPVAVIDCPANVLLTGPEVIELDGSDSYDPGGFDPIFYKWSVVGRPDASDVDIPLDPDNTAQIDLYVDVGGTWEVQLVVFNALFTQSEPVTCQFGAIPEDDVHIELSWSTALADLDLHLIRGGGVFFDEPDDCNYCNTNPEWGDSGPIDNPRLDIDDRGGFGPENINIEEPVNGTYDVKVHYWKENGDKAVTATVRVWLQGKEVWVGQKVLLHDQVWDVGTVSMPQGTFSALATPVYDAPRRGCF